MALTVKERMTAERHGVHLGTAYSRIYRGWDRERAVTTPAGKNWTQVARDNGINAETYNIRVYGYGWDKEVAATKPVDTRFRRKDRK